VQIDLQHQGDEPMTKRLLAILALAAALAACNPGSSPSPTVTIPDVEPSPGLESPDLGSPSFESPSLGSPDMESPGDLASPAAS
jgi:hypothetical protein